MDEKIKPQASFDNPLPPIFNVAVYSVEVLRVDERNQSLHARLDNFYKLTLIFGVRGAHTLYVS